MSGGPGRRAALPAVGYEPAPLIDPISVLTVRFVPEDRDEEPYVFDLSDWPVAIELRRAFTRALLARVGQARGIRTTDSARRLFRQLKQFAGYLSVLRHPPRTPGQLTVVHVKGWAMQHSHLPSSSLKVRALKALLRKVDGLHPQLAAFLAEREPRPPKVTIASYSRAEFNRIITTARRDVRDTAQRIRRHRMLLERWRSGQLEEQPRAVHDLGRLLDHVDRCGDVPRKPDGGIPFWVQGLGSTDEHIGRLHLTNADAVAFVVLLVGVTGQNLTTITKTPAAHHRPDGYAGGTATAIVELDKPRRRSRRHMDVAWSDLPSWTPAPAGASGASHAAQDAAGMADLRSPFAIYALAHDLTSAARRITGSDKLLVWYSRTGGRGMRRGFRAGAVLTGHIHDWAARHDLPADRATSADSAPESQLTVSAQRLRLTFSELHQRPVAHTEATLANDYLLRNRGNLAEYQQVVATVLEQEVAKAQTRGTLAVLPPAEVAEAREHPQRVAARHNIDPHTLARLLAGDLDTVMAACIDHTDSPHTPSGTPCTASFMLCLSCRCARALPSHLPVQVAVFDLLVQRRQHMTPLRWAQRFSLPHVQLSDLLQRAGSVAVQDARAALTAAQLRLAERFLNRELDLP